MLAALYLLGIFIYRFCVAAEDARLTVVIRFVMELVILAIPVLVVLDICRGIFTWTRNRILSVLGWILRIILVCICVVFIVLMIFIFHPDLKGSVKEPEYVLVLGLALENGRAEVQYFSAKSDPLLYAENIFWESIYIIFGTLQRNIRIV